MRLLGAHSAVYAFSKRVAGYGVGRVRKLLAAARVLGKLGITLIEQPQAGCCGAKLQDYGYAL